MGYDVSLYNLVELVVLVKTSLRSSKSESGCKSYYVFREVSFIPVVDPVQPAPRPGGPVPAPENRDSTGIFGFSIPSLSETVY